MKWKIVSLIEGSKWVKKLGAEDQNFQRIFIIKWDNFKSTLSIIIKKVCRYSRIVLLLVIRWMNMIKYMWTVKRFKMVFYVFCYSTVQLMVLAGCWGRNGLWWFVTLKSKFIIFLSNDNVSLQQNDDLRAKKMRGRE